MRSEPRKPRKPSDLFLNRALGWDSIFPRNVEVDVANLVEALRAAAACAIPVVASELLALPNLCWSAIAAFWVCLVDPGGPLRNRFIAMMSLAVIGAISSAASIWATTAGLWVAVAFGFFWSFFGTLARVYGEAAAKVGLFVHVTFLVSVGNFEGSSVTPSYAALLYFGGATWSILLTLEIWRIRPYQPSRKALSTVYAALSDFSTELGRLSAELSRDSNAWEAMASEHRRRVREAIDLARTTIAIIGRSRPGRSARSDEQLMLLQCADRIFAALIAISDYVEGHSPEWHPQLKYLASGLDEVPLILAGLSSAIRNPTEPLPVSLATRIAVASDHPRSESPDAYPRLIDTLFLYIRAAAATHLPLRQAPARAHEPVQHPRLRDLVWLPIAENFTRESISLRHALRVAVAASVALSLAFCFRIGHGYWLTMTTVLILQPYATMTWSHTIKRIVGSVLGGLFAAALGIVVHTPLSLALVIFPITVLTMIFRTVDYGLYVFFLTPQFVLISALSQPGTGSLALSWMRGMDTILGGVLALAAAKFLWPHRDSDDISSNLAATIVANRAYFLSVVGNGTMSISADTERRRAGIASNNAEATMQRVQSDPANRPLLVEAVMAVVTGARRLTGAITLLSILGCNHRELAAMVSWTNESMEIIERAATEQEPPATLQGYPDPSTTTSASSEAARALIRIRRQIEIIHAALTRLDSRRASASTAS
jgi:uncharacterized membrane protein YccC